MGTANYAAFLLIGANTFLMTLRAFWDIGLWLRKEQQTGTLESLYVTPADRRWLLVGLAAFNLARGLINFGLSFTLGCLVFAVNPLQGNWLVAIVFLCVGVTPLYALSLIYGAIVLRLKETNALIQIAQSVLTLAMGIYYPITVLPPLARAAGAVRPAHVDDERDARGAAGHRLHPGRVAARCGRARGHVPRRPAAGVRDLPPRGTLAATRRGRG